MQIGFLNRTPRGRVATQLAYEHFGITPNGGRVHCFEKYFGKWRHHARSDFYGAGAAGHWALLAGNSAGGFIFTSGQIPVDPATQQVITGDVAAQTDRVLKNLTAILEAAGSSLDKVVRCTVFLKNMGDFAAMNEVYGRYFKEAPPARSTVEVARLPKDVLVEIDAIALA